MSHPHRKQVEQRIIAWVILFILSWMVIGFMLSVELSGVIP